MCVTGVLRTVRHGYWHQWLLLVIDDIIGLIFTRWRARGLCTLPLRSSIHGVCRDMLPANAECELSVIVGVVRQLYWEAAHTGSAESLRRVIDG